jgi:anti-anti-sigma factor
VPDQAPERNRSHLVCPGLSEHDALIMLHPDSYQQFAAVREWQACGEVLHVFGDVDLSTVAQLDKAIEDASSDTLQINLAKCRYFDSSGLAALVRARNRFGSRLTVFVRPNTGVYRTLRIVGFDKMFNLVTELQTSCGYDARPAQTAELPAGIAAWI